MTIIDEGVTVWTSESGVPERMVWRGSRYRVTDAPTVWTEPSASVIPRSIGGWRFQGTDTETGEAFVFDVRSSDVRSFDVRSSDARSSDPRSAERSGAGPVGAAGFASHPHPATAWRLVRVYV